MLPDSKRFDMRMRLAALRSSENLEGWAPLLVADSRGKRAR